MQNKTIKILIILLILIFLGTISTNAALEVHFIDVGQGDSILIQEDNSANILIDGGNRWNSVEEKVISYLEENEVDTIDALISTHPHADHIGSLEAVINTFEVKEIYDSGRVHTSKTYENYLTAVDENNIPFDTPRRNEVIEVEGLEFKVLHPTAPVENYDLNNSSIVLGLEYGEVSFLFAGDIEAEVEHEILNSEADIKATILKVPHHGSNTSNSTGFIESVSPKAAVITVGEENKFGHPSSETINLFKKKEIKIYRTDENGDIVISTDGNNYSVNAEQKAAASIEEAGSKAKDGSLININTADKNKLDTLWGVGLATAENIIEYRESNNGFQSVDEIKSVDGIDDKKFRKLKDKITI
jgi:competence protein ComEC